MLIVNVGKKANIAIGKFRAWLNGALSTSNMKETIVESKRQKNTTKKVGDMKTL